MIDVIVADHDEFFHSEIAKTVAASDDFFLLLQPRSSEQLLSALRVFTPDVLVLSTSFLQIFPKLEPMLERGKTKLLVLAEQNDRTAYERRLGARGVVYRSMNVTALVDAMLRVSRGELAVQAGSSDTRQGKILYVCFNPAALASRECLLLSMGYEVQTVLGKDGVMALDGADGFDVALIGDEGPQEERQCAICLLKKTYSDAPVIALCDDSEKFPEADLHALSADPDTWRDAVAASISALTQPDLKCG